MGVRGGPMNRELLDLLIEHGADPNTQVANSQLYSHHVLYQAPPSKEGTSALHEAAQRGNGEMVSICWSTEPVQTFPTPKAASR